MGAIVLLIVFLCPALLAAFTRRFWPTILVAMIGFLGLLAGIAWWPAGLVLWGLALLVAIRAHRRAWRDRP